LGVGFHLVLTHYASTGVSAALASSVKAASLLATGDLYHSVPTMTGRKHEREGDVCWGRKG
jgi:hypothetical protein